jgi:hypothetical protein
MPMMLISTLVVGGGLLVGATTTMRLTDGLGGGIGMLGVSETENSSRLSRFSIITGFARTLFFFAFIVSSFLLLILILPIPVCVPIAGNSHNPIRTAMMLWTAGSSVVEGWLVEVTTTRLLVVVLGGGIGMLGVSETENSSRLSRFSIITGFSRTLFFLAFMSAPLFDGRILPEAKGHENCPKWV